MQCFSRGEWHSLLQKIARNQTCMCVNCQWLILNSWYSIYTCRNQVFSCIESRLLQTLSSYFIRTVQPLYMVHIILSKSCCSVKSFQVSWLRLTSLDSTLFFILCQKCPVSLFVVSSILYLILARHVWHYFVLLP